MVEENAITSKSRNLFDRFFLYLKSLSAKNISLYMSLGVVFSMPLPRPIGLSFVWLWILATLFEGKIITKAQQNFHKLTKPYLLLFAAFTVIHITSAILSEDMQEGFKSLRPLILAFIFPLIFLISSDLFKKKINLLLSAFLLGNIIALTLCIINAFIESVHFTGNDWYFQSSLSENMDFLSSLSKGKNQFTYTHFSVFKHTTYFAMYSIFSMGILTYFARIRFMKRWLIIVLLFYLLIGIFLLSSRAGILGAFIYFFFSIYVYFRNKRYFMLKFPAVIIALTGVLLLAFSHSRLSKSINSMQVKSEKSEGRIALWETSWEVVKGNWLFGLGIGDVEKIRKEVHVEKQLRETLIEKNSHNQYLEIWLGAGILGLLILLLLLVIPFIQSIKEKNYLLTLLTFLVGFNLLFESMLERFQGVFFIFFFLSLFLIVNPDKLKNTINRGKNDYLNIKN